MLLKTLVNLIFLNSYHAFLVPDLPSFSSPLNISQVYILRIDHVICLHIADIVTMPAPCSQFSFEMQYKQKCILVTVEGKAFSSVKGMGYEGKCKRKEREGGICFVFIFFPFSRSGYFSTLCPRRVLFPASPKNMVTHLYIFYYNSNLRVFSVFFYYYFRFIKRYFFQTALRCGTLQVVLGETHYG